MTKYEIMFIVKSTLEEDKIKSVSEELQKLINKKPSKVIEFKEMGRKKLTYPIKKEVSGYYYVMTVEADHDTIKEFDRKAFINENVLRHLIIKVEGE
jgi:small subunit ribosomal protein S6